MTNKPMQSFSDLAKSIAEERYKPTPSNDSINAMQSYHRIGYEACINERVKPLLEQLESTNNYLNGGGRIFPHSAAHKDITQAIANFEGGVKVAALDNWRESLIKHFEGRTIKFDELINWIDKYAKP